jgi:NMD protein affecting ribosome stability and mRNA decay
MGDNMEIKKCDDCGRFASSLWGGLCKKCCDTALAELYAEEEKFDLLHGSSWGSHADADISDFCGVIQVQM